MPRKRADTSVSNGEYASKVAYNWPTTLNDGSSTLTPVELYRTVLSTAADRSLHLISVGFLTNLADLLKSEPDQISHSTGIDLVRSKVGELIVMGGNYPSGWEFNFGGGDPASTIYVIDHWPPSVPITFSGFELGSTIYSGQNLAQDSPPGSPILAAYQWYVGRCSTIRESWDPLTVLYGVLGLEGFSQLGVKQPLVYANVVGYNSITSNNASNAWVNDTSVTNQHWLRLADGVTNSSMAWLLDQFFTHDPVIRSCFSYDAFS